MFTRIPLRTGMFVQFGLCLTPCAVLRGLLLLVAASAVPTAAQTDVEPEPVAREQVHAVATRLTYADGTVKLDIKGRSSNNPVTLLPTAEPEHPEPEPGPEDRRRGYLTFVPADREGVLPSYRPAPSERGSHVRIAASPDEREPGTLCVRPIAELGLVRFDLGPFVAEAGGGVLDIDADLYIVRPTIEQQGHNSRTCRWQAKWLEPVDAAPGRAGENLQVVCDLHDVLPE